MEICGFCYFGIRTTQKFNKTCREQEKVVFFLIFWKKAKIHEIYIIPMSLVLHLTLRHRAEHNRCCLNSCLVGLPQPTAEFPVVLFKDVNYNNCSSGEFMRVRAGVFEKWGENIPGSTQRRELKWRSMLMIPGVNVTFRACCPSGNNFVKVISNWTDTADINLSVLEYEHLKDSSGIWYESE